MKLKTIYLCAALITFFVSIIAVSYWFFGYRNSEINTQNANDSREQSSGNTTNSQPEIDHHTTNPSDANLRFSDDFLAPRSKKIAQPKDLVSFLKVRSREIEVRVNDINGDGEPEYFVKRNFGSDYYLTTLYQRQDNNFINLFESNCLWLDVEKGSKNGMRDIVEYGWLFGDLAYTHSKWTGSEYFSDGGCTRLVRSGKNKGRQVHVDCSE